MYLIENEQLKVIIAAKGAELQSIVRKDTGLEYMWSADPQYWAKKSPILFPIVGTLKGNIYQYKDATYQLGRHGFARDMEFAVTRQQADQLTLSLHATEQTRMVYPFNFRLEVSYALHADSLSVSYKVMNQGTGEMLFSVGGHPAFRAPLLRDEQYEDYALHFNRTETQGRWMISSGGLIEDHSVPLLDNTNTLPLKKELFYKDAVVFKGLQSDEITLRSSAGPHGLRFRFPGFPFFGVWAAKDADFICLEPWCGIADPVDADQQLDHKEGINRLQPGEAFDRTWSVTPF